MGIVSGVVVYVLVWWLVLFTVLPWGLQRAEPGEPVFEPGAPSRPRLWRKLGITTVIATVIFLIIYGIIAAELYSFRDAALG